MNKKLNAILTFLLTFLLQQTFAQEKTISGTISDQTGPLPGVTILIKGTSKGTQSNFDGNYTIKAKNGDVLVYSFLGMKTINKTINDSKTINIVMQIDNNQLDEVILTAQGIKKEARALGYSIKTINKDVLEQKSEGDIARVLNGKIAGVNITNTNGLSGSSTNIIIRGFSSITESNQPLFIVDGIPFDTFTNTQSNFIDGNTESSRFLDLDPNAIEKISVLKSLSATVAYGAAGRNGVILVTTKSGSTTNQNKKIEVTLNQSAFISEAILPKYQNNYGGGFNQGFGYQFSNWGPRFDRTDNDGISQATQFTGSSENGNATLSHPFNFLADQSLLTGNENLLDSPYEYKPYDGVKDFFKTGVIIATSLNIRGGGENANFNLNYSRNEDEGIVIGNSVLKNNFSLGGTAKLSNAIKVGATFNFSRTDYKSPPNAASTGSGAIGDGSSVFGDVLFTPRSIDLTNTPFQTPDGRSIYYRSANDIQNPYWTVNNAFTTQDTDRFFGTAHATINLTKWLSTTIRSGIDTHTEFNTYGQNRGGIDGDPTGIYRTIVAKNTNWDHNLIFSSDFDLNKKLNLKTTLGFNSRRLEYEQDGSESTGQLAFGVLEHFNFSTTSSTNSFNQLPILFKTSQNTAGIYFDGTLSYKDYLYFNAIARNDWTSTVESNNNSIFYPGTSISFIPTSAFSNFKSNTLNFLKVRLGYGSSAGFPTPYNTRNTLDLSSRDFVDQNSNVISSNTTSNQLGNPNLKPEVHRELEFGLDTKLFNRLNFNINLYRKTTTDLITEQDIDPSTGFNSQQVNIGELLNKGIEIDYSLDIIKTTRKGFSFNVSGNFAAGETTVTDLPEGSDIIPLTRSNINGEAANYAVEDRPYGVLHGTTILKDDNGNNLIGEDGLYLESTEISEIGDPNPDWTTTLTPTIKYKGFNLTANIQYRHGGDIFSTTAATLIGRGVVDLDNPIDRETSYILPGVLKDGSPNNIAITATNLGFDTYLRGPNELNIFDGSTIRLQEVSLGYQIPQKALEKSPFRSLSLTLSGFNLWYKAVNFADDLNYDTNSSGTGVGNGQGLDFINGPSTRRIGLSIKATF